MLAGADNTSWGHKSSLIPTTWNPADKAAGISLTNGNRTATWGSYDESLRGVHGVDIETEFAYLEFTPDNEYATGFFGIANASAALTGTNHYADGNSWMLYVLDGRKQYTTATAYGASGITPAQIGMMAIGGGKVWWGVDGTYFASGDPAAGTGAAFTGLTGIMYPYAFHGSATAAAYTINCGQEPFAFGPPSGFPPGWGAIE